MGGDKMINKKFLIAAVVVGAVIIAVLIGINSKYSDKNGTTKTRIDKDTGETIVTNVGEKPETNASKQITLLGGEKLYNSMSATQFDTTRIAIENYLHNFVSQDITTAKILPDTVQVTEVSVSATLKVDSPAKSIAMTIQLIKSRAVNITFNDPTNQTNPTYKTGILPIEQDGSYSGGDGVAPDQQ